MRCEIHEDVVVHRSAVFAEMAKLERRPELGALCRAAQAAQGRIDPALVQTVLPGVSSGGAWNVVDWCKMLGLVDNRGALTRSGEEVARDGDAPVPEQGVFELWHVDHPLLGRRILHAAPLRIDRDVHFDELAPLPSEPQANTTFRSVVGPERFVLRKLLGSGGLAASRDQSSCQVRWTIHFLKEQETFRLEGQLEVGDTLRPIQHEPERAGIDVASLREAIAWEHFGQLGAWKPAERRLCISYSKLSDAEKETFKKAIAIGSLSIPGKGRYNNVTLEDVPIGPPSRGDAQPWAVWRLERKLAKMPSYVTRGELRQTFTSRVEKTPLEAFAPELPAHETLLQQRSADARSLFQLAAPVDLSPEPAGPHELGPFVVEPVQSARRHDASLEGGA